MKLVWKKGVAFILEGQTEKEFYSALLDYLCVRHNTNMLRLENKSTPDVIYKIETDAGSILIKFYVVKGIYRIPKAANWVKAECRQKYDPCYGWQVFLCYDKGDYIKKISKSNRGDWKVMKDILLQEECDVTDIAADADIEDVMLKDIGGVCTFLGCKSSQIVLCGSEGKSKMKNLFRENNKIYHEGIRARTLIRALNMERIIASKILPLQKIEDKIFK